MPELFISVLSHFLIASVLHYMVNYDDFFIVMYFLIAAAADCSTLSAHWETS